MISNLVIGLKSLSHKMTVPSFDPVAKPSSFPCTVNIAAYRDQKNQTRFIKHCDSRVGVYHHGGRIHPLGCCRCIPLSSKLSSMYRRNVNKLNKPNMMLFFFFFFLLLTQTAFPQIRWNKSHHKKQSWHSFNKYRYVTPHFSCVNT